MALKKSDLESKLNALSRREVKPVELGTETSEEIFAKFSTKTGNVDGEILGGIGDRQAAVGELERADLPEVVGPAAGGLAHENGIHLVFQLDGVEDGG